MGLNSHNRIFGFDDLPSLNPRAEKTLTCRSDCLGQVNLTFSEVKKDVLWAGGKVKLASVNSFVSLNENVSLKNDNSQSKAIV